MLLYLGTKSKVKPKQKTKAERAEYEAWCKKHGINPYGKSKKAVIGNDKSPVEVTKPYYRETPNYPSRDSGCTGAVNTGNVKHVYTGDAMIGIASMHKSNYVPVFKAEEAVDLAHMRR